MADEGDDWFGGGGDDDAPPAVKPVGKKGEEAAEAAEEAEQGEEAPEEGEGAAEAPLPEADEEYLDPDKLILFKHWVRPKFLPYKCIYDYRKNYYDDVMEVLESRRRGVRRTIPPAQTWAERLCRQRNDPLWKLQTFDKFLDDVRLVTRTQISGDLYSYYAKDQFNKRYSKLLY
ncbi:unnamed protein product [Phyllotreta striolata]|uniref:Uncharacterized protein n=1 Tax=Phyllotreta striolata TaxID=444603 RepID=A0A9N9TP67_PHYSR|nr:unnamed protein product [Phyllotreta striolata]